MNELIIEPGRADRQYWRDLWRYRELFLFLAWRDVLVRYKQTVAGVSWAVIRPFLTVVVFTVVFGRFANLPSGGVPYPILVFAGVLPWQFFSNAISETGTSLLNNSNLISKVYFPRMVVPGSAIVTSLIDFLVAGVCFGALMVWYRFVPGWQVLALPLFILLAAGLALGAGLWLGALTVKYRDFRVILPFMVQFGFFISPVGYSTEVVPEQWRTFYYLNPVAGIIDGFRWGLLGRELFIPGTILSVFATCAILWIGARYFRKTERAFADVI